MSKVVELFKYILLAFIQGVGEILPISSSGHLLLIRNLIGLNIEGIGIEIFLHFSSLLALFVFYKKTIFEIIRGFFNFLRTKNSEYKKDFIFVKGMIISLIPVVVVGYFFNDYIDYFLSYTFFVGVFLILNAFNLYLIRNKVTNKSVESLSSGSFLRIGIGQCLGLVPGFSRSGACLSMCYREKMNKEDSKKFTFIILFPLVVGSLLLNLDEFCFDKEMIIPLSVSFILTFIITLFSLGLLNQVINANKLHYFAYYCLVVGVVVMFASFW